MIEIKKNWNLVFYAALASASCSALSFLGMFIAEICNSIGWEVGLLLAFAIFGCTAVFLLLLYVIPYIIRYIVRCFEYFKSHRK